MKVKGEGWVVEKRKGETKTRFHGGLCAPGLPPEEIAVEVVVVEVVVVLDTQSTHIHLASFVLRLAILHCGGGCCPCCCWL